MTAEEKRQQKAMLLLEYQEAEEDLAHLETRSRTLAAGLNDLSEWLLRWADRANTRVQTHEIQTQGRIRSIDSEHLKHATDFEAVKQLAADIQQARVKLAALKESKAALGLK